MGDSVGLQQDDIRGRLQTAQVEPLLNPTHFGRDFSFAIQCGWASGNDRNGIDSIQEIVASSFSATLERVNFSISEAVAWGQYQEEWRYRLLRTEELDQIKSLFKYFFEENTLLYRQYPKTKYFDLATFTLFNGRFSYFYISPWCLLDDLAVKFMQL